MTARSRYALRRDRLRGGPPRELQPCGTIGAIRRHQRAGEKLCDLCAPVEAERQARLYRARKARKA